MGPDAMIFVFWMLNFKPTFSLSSFTFIKRLFSSSSLSAHFKLSQIAHLFLIVQWLGLCASTAGCMGLIPGGATRVPLATWGSQNFLQKSFFFKTRILVISYGSHLPHYSGKWVLVAQLHRSLQPARLLCPCSFPGKNTGVGCHSFLQLKKSLLRKFFFFLN